MYAVYEVFKDDGKRFCRFESDDRTDCEVWIRNHVCDMTEVAYLIGRCEFVIEEE